MQVVLHYVGFLGWQYIKYEKPLEDEAFLSKGRW